MPQTPWPATLRWCGSPTRCASAAVLNALAPVTAHYRLVPRPRKAAELTYLDTADRRLHRSGLTLSHHRNGSTGQLVLSDDRGPRSTATLTAVPKWPAKVEQLPDGPVRQGVGPAVWIRAIAPVAGGRSVSRTVSVLDGDGVTVARLEWLEVTLCEPAARPPIVRVNVRPVPGYRRDAAAVARSLLGSGGFEPASGTIERAVLDGAAPGPAADGQVSVAPGTAGQRADVAVAAALLRFAAEIMANLDGTIADVDTEFLHDFRVGVRRSRSLLKQGVGVLPAGLVSRYAPELKWLGDLTTPTRDLDVYLLELDELGRRLQAGRPEDLELFATHLSRERVAARRALVRGLRSARFGRLMSGWRSALLEVIDGQASELTAAEFAAARITRLDRRVRRLARAITPDSPSESVHDLRKRCKELRYVLEVFRPLADPEAYRRATKDLKQVQDVLGSFQDAEVQSAALRVFAQQMLDAGPVPAGVLLALGELSGAFAGLQQAARVELTARLKRFAGTPGAASCL